MNRGSRLFWSIIACLFCSLLTVETASAAERSVIVGFRQAPGAAEQALISGKKGRINRKFRRLPVVTATLPESEIAALRANPNVAYVAENTIYAVTTTLPGTEYVNSWNAEQIGAKIAHDANIRGAGVKVAVLDTGIDFTHSELTAAYQGGIDIVGGTAAPTDESLSSHGTHVAGIIAGALNADGVVGIAPGVSLYAVRIVFGFGGNLADLIAGIDWAIDNQMQIINLSNGIDPDADGFGPDEKAALADAIARAELADILVVAAVGNAPGRPVSHPAVLPSVVAVTATDRNKQIASFTPAGSAIDLAAPGVDITSTVKGGYESQTGTSMATPQVTGVAALILSAGLTDENGNGSRLDELRTRLQETAEDLGDLGKDDVYGYGLVNVVNGLCRPPALATGICAGSGDPGTDPGTDPVIVPTTKLDLVRQSRLGEDDAQVATLTGGKVAIKIVNNGLKSIKVEVYKDDVFVKDLSGKLTFNRKTYRGVTLPFDASAGPYQVVFTPAGKFGSSATLLFNAPTSAMPGAVKGHNRKFK